MAVQIKDEDFIFAADSDNKHLKEITIQDISDKTASDIDLQRLSNLEIEELLTH